MSEANCPENRLILLDNGTLIIGSAYIVEVSWDKGTGKVTLKLSSGKEWMWENQSARSAKALLLDILKQGDVDMGAQRG